MQLITFVKTNSFLINCVRLSFLVCFFPFFSIGQGTVAPKYSNEFLSLGIGADALGFSNAVVAQTNSVTSGYWNPAGLVRSNKWLDIGLMHSEHFAGIAKHDYLGISHKIDEKSAAAFSIIRFAVDDIPNTTQLIDNEGRIDYDRITTFTAADYAFLFSYARKTKFPGLAVGGNFKLIYRKVGSFAKSWGFGLDAGVTYEKSERLKFGAVIRDVTSTFNAWIFTLDNQTKEVFTLTGNEIPKNGLELTLPRIILGTYYKQPLGKKGIYVAGELDVDITTDGKRNTLLKTKVVSLDPHLGIAFGFKEYVAVRTGISNMQFIKNFDDSKQLSVQPNLGIGVHFKAIYLDYAFTNIGQSLYSHVVSIRLALNKPKNLEKKEHEKE